MACTVSYCTYIPSNSAPIAGLHNCAKETTLGGYTIPQNTVVITNFYSLHNDPQFWPDPDKFDPLRFLDESSKLKKMDAFMQFGLGE